MMNSRSGIMVFTESFAREETKYSCRIRKGEVRRNDTSKTSNINVKGVMKGFSVG